MWWDDGTEQNTYVVGLGSTLATNTKFTGQATIAPGWTAGYVIHMEAMDSDSLTINQFSEHNPSALQPLNPSSGAYTVQLLQSFWFIKSDHLGKVGVGLQSSPSDNAAILVDGSGSLVPANWVMFDYNNFQIRNKANGLLTGVVWGQLGSNCRAGGGTGGDCFGAPRDSVRYDSPTFAGFSVSAGWGEDDFWDVAGRYSGEYNGFKLAAAVAYSEWDADFFTLGPVVNPDGRWTKYFQAGAYVEHVPTGIWLYGAYGHISTDGVTPTTVAVGVLTNTLGGIAVPDGNTYYIKGGLRERWHPLGHTVLYGEYAKYSGSITDVLINNGVTDADTQLWGLGVVQEIDAAAMSIWLKYRHVNGSIESPVGQPANALTNLDSFQYVGVGGLINY
jgi:hypothetical protein